MVSLIEINEERGRRRKRSTGRGERTNGTSADARSTTPTATTSSSGNGAEKMRKLLLGIGFWVQGLRCFPWLGVNFFLKDGLKVDSSTLQILQNSANLPMVAKPFYGIISDSYYILGQHRIPYIAIGANEERGGRRRGRGSSNVTTNTSSSPEVHTTASSSSKKSEKMRKFLLGIGFWVQGFRFCPWLAVNFFLKDGLRVDPSALQILQSSAYLPMVAKPFYGIISDSFYIFGQHRTPYIVIGAVLQAISWLAIAFLSRTGISFFTITFYLLLGNFGASVVEVANDAIVAETSKQPVSSKNSKPSSSGDLQSFVWMASAIGGVLGNLVGGVAIDKFSPQAIFFMFGIILTIQFLVTIFIHESSLNLPKTSSSGGIKKQLSELLAALRKPEISYSIAWFAATYAIVPSLIGTMFYYQTEHLKIESSVLGISKVIGQVAMLFWGVIYEKYFKSVPPRKVISSIQVTMAVFMLADILFVKGLFRTMGFPDSVYVMVFSGVLEALFFTKILPFSVLIAQLCPPGCEGSVMAFLMSSIALAFIVSGYFGVALASFLGVTGNDFSGFPLALLIQAACTLLPLYWSYYVPDPVKSKTNGKDN